MTKPPAKKKSNRSILVIDVGGSHVKFMTDAGKVRRKFDSGPDITPREMVREVKSMTKDWPYDCISVGYPGPVLRNRPTTEPHNLGKGWKGFDLQKAFGRPTKLVNDAVMQALGSYRGGKMLFLGLGTGLGSAMIVDGTLVPMELAHLPYRTETFEDYVGERGLERYGKKKWRRSVEDVIARLVAALEPEYVVLGGGNAEKLGDLPPNVRLGDNDKAFEGGFRLWKPERIRKNA
jgi:polyphosphate glucokinase